MFRQIESELLQLMLTCLLFPVSFLFSSASFLAFWLPHNLKVSVRRNKSLRAEFSLRP